MPTETQGTISAWIEATFGPAGSDARVAARANEELAELLERLVAGDAAKAVVEAADVAIVLYRLATRLGVTAGPAAALEYEKPDLAESLRRAVAANLAMSELLRRLTAGGGDAAAGDPTPRAHTLDVLAGVHGVAAALGCDLAVAIDAKMAVNRARRWRLDGSGCGYHVKD